MALTGIDSAEKLLFTSRYPEEKHTINRLKARHLFCEKLGKHKVPFQIGEPYIPQTADTTIFTNVF